MHMLAFAPTYQKGVNAEKGMSACPSKLARTIANFRVTCKPLCSGNTRIPMHLFCKANLSSMVILFLFSFCLYHSSFFPFPILLLSPLSLSFSPPTITLSLHSLPPLLSIRSYEIRSCPSHELGTISRPCSYSVARCNCGASISRPFALHVLVCSAPGHTLRNTKQKWHGLLLQS